MFYKGLKYISIPAIICSTAVSRRFQIGIISVENGVQHGKHM